MAFSNYLTQGTYSFIDNVVYSKRNASLRFSLRIFKDENLSIELASKNFDVTGRDKLRELKGSLSSPPERAALGDAYLVAANSEDGWKNREGCIAVLERSGWSFWKFSPQEIFYTATPEGYYTIDANHMMHPAFPLNDVRLWNTWFSGEKIFLGTTNLYAQIYKFLKTNPGFENVIDT